jgi:hypothetical protein
METTPTNGDNIVPLRPSNDPSPNSASELCPGPCDDGDICFCALGMGLVYQGIRQLKAKWPTLTDEEAARLVGEMVVSDAFIVARTLDSDDEVRTLISALIEDVVSNAFHSWRADDIDDMRTRWQAERNTRQIIENVLRECVRDLDRTIRLRRERRATAT